MGSSKNKRTKVIYSNTGMANYYGDHIEINKYLKKDKKLRDFVIKHELGHTTGFDLGYEVADGFRLVKNPNMAVRLISFYITHPSTWSDLLPIQIKKGMIVYDLNLTILYTLVIILCSVIFFIF